MAEQESYVLTAWQLYAGLFFLFWATHIYFSSFWISLLCCLKFGLAAQLLTDYMYRRGRYQVMSVLTVLWTYPVYSSNFQLLGLACVTNTVSTNTHPTKSISSISTSTYLMQS